MTHSLSLKRIISYLGAAVLMSLFAVVLAFSFTGCGGNKNKGPFEVKFYSEQDKLFESVTVEKDGYASLSKSPEKVDSEYNETTYTFVGWKNSDGEIVDLSKTKITADTSFTASFEAKSIYTYLNFNKIDGGYEVTGLNDNTVTEITLPATFSGEKVIKIADRAFEEAEIEEFTFGANIETIGTKAFKRATLVAIEVPASVKVIGDRAFQDCTSLETVILNENLNLIMGHAFERVPITEIIIPNSVTEIGESAFNQTNLEMVKIGNGVITIGAEAFNNCTKKGFVSEDPEDPDIKAPASLKTLILGENVKVIGSKAFAHTEALQSVEFGSKLETISSQAFLHSGITSIEIPNSVTTLGDSAFNTCSSLQSVKFGSGLTSVPSNAFLKCSNLNSVIFSETIKTIGEKAFYNAGFVTLEIPDTIEVIENEAFKGCRQITSLTIGKGVSSIGVEAFRYLYSLTELNVNAVSINDSVKGDNIFKNAGENSTGINVVFGDEVEYIPAYFLYAGSKTTGVPNVVSIKIGRGVESVGAWAFQYLAKVKNVTIDSSKIYEAANSTDSYAAGGLLKYAAENQIDVKVLITADTGNNAYLSNGTFDVTVEGDYNIYKYNPALVPETPDGTV